MGVEQLNVQDYNHLLPIPGTNFNSNGFSQQNVSIGNTLERISAQKSQQMGGWYNDGMVL